MRSKICLFEVVAILKDLPIFLFRLVLVILLASTSVNAAPLSLFEMKEIKFEQAGPNGADPAASFRKWLNLNAEDKRASILIVLESIHSETTASNFNINGINHCITRQFTSANVLFDLIRGCDDPMVRPMEALQVCVVQKMFPLDPNVSPAEMMKDRSRADKINKTERMVTMFFLESGRRQQADLQSFLNDLISEGSKEIAEERDAADFKLAKRDDFFFKVIETMKECDKRKDG